MTSDLHPLGDTLLRSPETYARYHDNPKRKDGTCFICETPAIISFGSWKVIKNEFPYDAIAESHFLLAPIRHFGEIAELEPKEAIDLGAARTTINEDVGAFDAILENTKRARTVLGHYHLHLLRWKRV